MTKLFFLLFFSTIIHSQSISKQVIGFAGKTQTNSNLKLSWTSGDPIVGMMTAGGNQLGNGYYPALNLKTLNIEDSTIDLQIIVYPNPTSKMLFVSHPDLSSFSIQIISANGQQIYSGTIQKEQPLDISNYTQGNYFVNIKNKNTGKKNTYKIIKK